MKTELKVLTVAIAIGLAQTAIAQDKAIPLGKPDSKSQKGVIGPGGATTTTVINGTIDAIDASRRTVTLKEKDGKSLTMSIGPSINNFDKLKKGDKVTARYTEALAMGIDKGNDSDLRKRIEASSASQAKDGKPGMQSMNRVMVVANVFELDRESGRLTLRGTNGEPVEVRVNDKQALKDIDTGDQVVISYVEASAVSIEPRAKGS